MTRNRDLANLLDSNGQIDNADIADNTIASSKLSYNASPFRNIIINGDMSIAQRGTSFAGVNDNDYTLDRFQYDISGTDVYQFTISQDTDVPTGQGFAKSMKIDCTTADATLDADNYATIMTKIEGQNLQYLKKGTANAESVTMSFWVKSAKTGTYICELFDVDNNRVICKSYTIDTANTWEKKTITYAGDTTGAFANSNGGSLRVIFWLLAGTDFTSGTLATSWESRTNANRAVGQVNLADDTANDFWITGVQLEEGTTASDFEFLPYDVNLQRCLRYYYLHMSGISTTFGMGLYYTSTFVFQSYPYPVQMRTIPSLDQVSGTGYYEFFRNGATDVLDDFVLNASGRTNEKYYEIYNSSDVSGTAGQAGFFRGANANAYIAFDAEL